MVLTYEEFISYASHLEMVSSTLKDTWKIYYTNHGESKTLYLKKMKFSSAELGCNILWEYHIVYNYSYSVPVMYFNACFDNGKLLSLENLEHFVDPMFKDQFIDNKWNILTQQEHPLIRRPFYAIHPCHTEDFIKDVADTKINPLVTWLSSIAPMVNLKLDIRYGSAEFTLNEGVTN